jgi:amino-acid N-acetyltransferase
MPERKLRKARLADAPAVAELINFYAARKAMLARSIEQVCEGLRDFTVSDDDGRIVGCCALRLWSDWAEVRSLAVEEGRWGKGLGAALVGACLKEAGQLGVGRVFTLTYQPAFFEKLGFARVAKETFPQKIWRDCVNCPEFPQCAEIALAMELT